jgi:hypothetical protein
VPASIRAGRPSNTDATALPTNGGHPITIVVADDISIVEHLGNAGRPHTAADRPNTSMHRPSGPSRSYVLASLRALHLDRPVGAGATSTKRALTGAPHTGNAGLSQILALAVKRTAWMAEILLYLDL